jgi:ABC-type lipoprotein release transport system permease subunit
MLQALTGATPGLAGAVLLSKLMSKMLYGVQPTDPLTFGAVTNILALASVVATSVPAHKASQIEPMVALRNE